MQNMISVIKIFDGVVVTAGGTALSAAIDLTLSGRNLSLQLQVTGDGTLKAEKELSNNETDYLIPEGGGEIIANVTKTSGPGTNGKLIKAFTTEVAGILKILLTETGGANPVTVTGWLAVQ